MADFASLAAFAGHLSALTVNFEHAQRDALEEAAVLVEKEAKRSIGTYDYGWPKLAPSTLARKSADTPLLETGEMRDSIGHTIVSRDEAQVGSSNDKAVWHELGTAKVPPRPFLTGAAMHSASQVREIVERRVRTALIKP